MRKRTLVVGLFSMPGTNFEETVAGNWFKYDSSTKKYDFTSLVIISFDKFGFLMRQHTLVINLLRVPATSSEQTVSGN